MTSRKSLQYFLTKSILQRDTQKGKQIHLAQERLKEHVVFCPAKFCKIYEVYRKEKKGQDLIDYTCCPPEIKQSAGQEELSCPCEEVSCDYPNPNPNLQPQFSSHHQNFEPPQRCPPHHHHHHHHGHRHRHPPTGFASPHSFHGPNKCPPQQRYPQQNLSYNHPMDDAFSIGLGLDLNDEDSPYNFKDLPIPECLCDVRGCSCPGVRYDNGDIPQPLFHGFGGPKAFCRNIKCSNLQEVLKNPVCEKKRVRKPRGRKVPCLEEEPYMTLNADMLKNCQFRKKLQEEKIPNPCTANTSQNSSYRFTPVYRTPPSPYQYPHFHRSSEKPCQGMNPLTPF